MNGHWVYHAPAIDASICDGFFDDADPTQRMFQ